MCAYHVFIYVCVCTNPEHILLTLQGFSMFYSTPSFPFSLALCFHFYHFSSRLSPVSFSSGAVYHCCLAGLCVNPGLVQQPCLLSPLSSTIFQKVLLAQSTGIGRWIHVCVYEVLTNSFLHAPVHALQTWHASIIFNPSFLVQAEAVWWRSYGAWSWSHGLCGGWCTIMEAAGQASDGSDSSCGRAMGCVVKLYFLMAQYCLGHWHWEYWLLCN